MRSPLFSRRRKWPPSPILGDIIIPRDSISGSASDAKVPDFIEFIVKDMPEHQTPMRGGLRWLDLQCLNRYGKAFTECEHKSADGNGG